MLAQVQLYLRTASQIKSQEIGIFICLDITGGHAATDVNEQ